MKWIKIKDKLPNENQNVFLRFKKGDIELEKMFADEYQEYNKNWWLENVEEWLDESEEEIIDKQIENESNIN